MEKLTEGTLLQVNATIIAGIFIFISLLSLNIFDLPFRFDNTITTPGLLTQGNIVTIFIFLIIMIYPFIFSSIYILASNKFDTAKTWSIIGFIIILVIFSIIIATSVKSMIEQMII
jgi:hypothetical protein